MSKWYRVVGIAFVTQETCPESLDLIPVLIHFVLLYTCSHLDLHLHIAFLHHEPMLFILLTWPSHAHKLYESLAKYVKLGVVHAPGVPRMFSPPPRVSDRDMQHGTWRMPGSLISGFLWSRCRENVPSIPGACAICKFTYLVRGPWNALVGMKIIKCANKSDPINAMKYRLFS